MTSAATDTQLTRTSNTATQIVFGQVKHVKAFRNAEVGYRPFFRPNP